MTQLDASVAEALKVSYDTESSQKTVSEFVERYEPIYVQR